MGRTYNLYIEGKWISTPSAAEIKNPYTGKTVGKVGQARKSEMEQAIGAASRAYESTKNLPAYKRAEGLERIASGLARRREEVARIIVSEAGKPWQFAVGEVDRAISTFTIAAEEARRTQGELIPADRTPVGEGYTMLARRFPIGPIGAISPFNFPLNLVAHKAAPALAAGNTLVLKPPHQAPITSLLLAEIVDQAGFPPGAFNVVPCPVEVAEHLSSDERIKMLSFTGSARVGWYLKRKAGKKKVALELGGNAAAVVHEDADLEWSAKRLAAGAFAYAGQVCISVQRVYVQESIFTRFMEKFLDAVKKTKSGDPMDPETVVGPLIDTEAGNRVEQWVEEARKGGAEILVGGNRKDNVLDPTVIVHATKDMKVNCEEVFGPVVTVTPYQDFQDVLKQVNDSPYGLQAGVFTYDVRNILSAFQELEVGGVMINEYPTFRVDHMPYGGIKESGFGREGVKYAMAEMTELKLLVIRP